MIGLGRRLFQKVLRQQPVALIRDIPLTGPDGQVIGHIDDLHGSLPNVSGVDLVSVGRPRASGDPPGRAASGLPRPEAVTAVLASLGRSHDLIVLDAFSSDAVPVHLLSREAIALYRRKLAPGGAMAFNLSSKYLDLPPLMARQAADAGLPCRVRRDLSVPEPALRAGRRPSIWAVLADLPGLPPSWGTPSPRVGSSAWTDDYSDLVSYLLAWRRPGGRAAR